MGDDSDGGRTGRHRLPALLRLARFIAAVVLAVVAAVIAYWGAMVITFDFTRSYHDSPLVLIGTPPLLLAALLTFAAWLVLASAVPGRRSAARALLVTLAFVLPAVLGVATAVYNEVIVQTMPYPGTPIGYTFDYPRDWSLFPPENPEQAPETVTFMSWAAISPGEPVPPDEMKVRIGPYAGPLPAGTAFDVGRGNYPGTVQRGPATGPEAPYTITVVYQVGARRWQIVGEFPEALDAADPRTKTFFDIVASLRHG